MQLIYDPHTHTSYSHGKNTALEMVQAAKEKGLKGIYITEHGPFHHYAKKIKKEGFLRLKDEVEKCKALFPEMDIRYGAEGNIISLSGEIDCGEDYDDVFEFVNIGYHMMVIMKDIKSNFSLQARSICTTKLGIKSMEESFRATCTDTLLKTLDCYKINMITHPGRNYLIDVLKIAEKCAQTGTLMEINDSKGLLSAENLKLICQNNSIVKFAVGSDAHCVENVGKCNRAFEIIEKSGIDKARVVNIR